MTAKTLIWDKSFDVGVEEMNDDHKVIISLMDELFCMNESNAPFEDIMATLEKLLAVTVDHFKREEEYMESVGYEWLNSHKKAHEHLIADLKSFTQQIKESKTLTAPFFHFLNVWMREHIQHADMKYNPEYKVGMLLCLKNRIKDAS